MEKEMVSRSTNAIHVTMCFRIKEDIYESRNAFGKDIPFESKHTNN
jgi:hypothetical protein